MDGDQIGMTIQKLGEDQHRKFSRALADFARDDVPRIVEQEHLGRLVYAGGDDVLALLPIRDALTVAETLRTEFEQIVADLGITNPKGEAVTASTGMAYVHHTHNLQDAVDAAKNAQKLAKEQYHRSAIAVEFLRRSGEPRSMGHKWVAMDQPLEKRVSALVDAFANGLSRNLPYDVAQIAYSMEDVNVPDDARNAELRRVLKRRLREDKKDIAEQLSNHILALAAVSESKLKIRWQSVPHWLELARFIAQTTDIEGD